MKAEYWGWNFGMGQDWATYLEFDFLLVISFSGAETIAYGGQSWSGCFNNITVMLSHVVSPDQLVAHRTFHWVVGNWETAFNGLNLLLVQKNAH